MYNSWGKNYLPTLNNWICLSFFAFNLKANIHLNLFTLDSKFFGHQISDWELYLTPFYSYTHLMASLFKRSGATLTKSVIIIIYICTRLTLNLTGLHSKNIIIQISWWCLESYDFYTWRIHSDWMKKLNVKIRGLYQK